MARKPTSRAGRQRRAAALAGVLAASLWLILAEDGPRLPSAAPKLSEGAAARGTGALGVALDRPRELETRAARAVARVLYAKSPGGLRASAARTAAHRALIEAAARRSGANPDELEALVLLESAGRPDAIVGGDPVNAAGLVQIVSGTATALLGMKVDVAASRRITRQIARAQRRSRPERVRRLTLLRRAVDERFDPARALAGAGRYLALARAKFGREDLALASYHMGMGNLETALRAYAGTGAKPPIRQLVRERRLSYAALYFGSSPVTHAAAWGALSRLGDESALYLFKLRAAQDVMRLHRSDPGELQSRERLLLGSGSSELALHPPGEAEPATSGAMERVRPGPGLRISRTVPPGERILRPDAAAALRELARLSARIAPGKRGLLLIGASSQEQPVDGSATHAAGWGFDIARRYADGAQALAFQFALDRLKLLGVLDWIRFEDRIHIAAAPGAAAILR